MTIDLASPSRIPPEILSSLQEYEAAFRREEFLDALLDDRRILGVVEHLNQVCVEQGIVGYHYTRAVREQIVNEGLVAHSGRERRGRFLAEYGPKFMPEDRAAIDSAWKKYFDGRQDSARNGRVWFALTLGALTNGSADRLLSYFGGEGVYMPLTRIDSIAAVLRRIGEPLVVSCRLDATWAKTFIDLPWGKAWLSAHHATRNPTAHRIDCDVYVCGSMPPERIICIRAARDLGWMPRTIC